MLLLTSNVTEEVTLKNHHNVCKYENYLQRYVAPYHATTTIKQYCNIEVKYNIHIKSDKRKFTQTITLSQTVTKS